jgi:phosphatidylinositol-bisphosphatase
MRLHIVANTWNVHGKRPVQSLIDWISGSNRVTAPHVIAIGLQEIVSFSEYQRAVEVKNEWERWIQSAIDEEWGIASFRLVYTKRFVGLATWVFVRSEWQEWSELGSFPDGKRYQYVVKDAPPVGVGLFNLYGNKGGMCVRLSIRNKAKPYNWMHVALLNTHLLASGRSDLVPVRNDTFRTILRDTVFHNCFDSPQIEKEFPAFLEDQDTILVFGDLNYRLDSLLPNILTNIEQKNVSGLLEHDQLSRVLRHEHVLKEFREGAISFLPTYKYQVGSISAFDNSTKRRIPSYCDRILYLCTQPHSRTVEVLEYNSFMGFTSSDHKPVLASFMVKWPTEPKLKRFTFTRKYKSQLQFNTEALIVFIIEILLLLWSFAYQKVKDLRG